MTGDRQGRRPALDVLGLVGLAGAIAALHLLGSGDLARPPLTSFDGLRSWIAEREPVTIGLAAARLGALVVAYHLVLSGGLALAGRILHRPSLGRLADAITVPPLRRTVHRLAGLILSMGALAATSSAVGVAAATPTTAGSTATLRPGSDPSDGSGTATLRASDQEPTSGASGSQPPSSEPATSDTAASPVGGPSIPVGGGTRTEVGEPAAVRRLRAGDHLWAIAEEALADHLGRAPADAEVDPYWRRLILANPQIVDPDLVFPGDVITMPPLG